MKTYITDTHLFSVMNKPDQDKFTSTKYYASFEEFIKLKRELIGKYKNLL